MGAYIMNVVGDFLVNCDFNLLNLRLPPLNHNQYIGRKINKDRRVWDKVPIKAISAKQKDWQTRVVGFMCDVWVFAEKGIPEDQISWISELYGTRAKL